MIEENLIVYEALKNTALHCEDSIRNARIQMYTIYFVVLPFGFTYHWLFLLTFMILMAFQSIMNTERFAIERVSSYIRVFFEEKRDDMHWSLLNKDFKHLSTYSKQYRNIGWYINAYASSILAVIAFASMIAVYIINQYYETRCISIFIIVQIIVALVLCIMTIFINTRYYDFKNGKKTIEILDDGIRDFYTTHCNNSTTI